MAINPKTLRKKNILFNEADDNTKLIIKKAMNENEKFSYKYKALNNYYPKELDCKKLDNIW